MRPLRRCDDADFLATVPGPGVALPEIDVTGPDRFINRELSWLAFNWRVMAEAENPATPLLERVRFLSISASNLDEFYSVRVAGLRGLQRARVAAQSADRLPTEQLRRIDADARALMMRQQECWGALQRELTAEGIEILAPADLKAADVKTLEAYFFEQVFPILSPLAIDPAHPFPFIANGGFAMGLKLRREEDDTVLLLPVPAQVPRLVRLAPGAKGSCASCRWRDCWRSASTDCFRAMRCSATVASDCCATATWRWRKRPRIWCASSRPC